ncbi:MAG TPA: L-seryl-tRNA(Sec) selenium transferase [Bryobacteraceae bacterium]|nr:L-seryl-tRNA(Sec) selenium transferase [Bryobacteraceae bacterium]
MAEITKLRDLPSVDEMLVGLSGLQGSYPRALIAAEIRLALAEARRALRAGSEPPPLLERVRDRLAALAAPSLRPVINATGVILHTNLGRAPLGPAAVIPGFSNLEYDLAAGKRGRRDAHTGRLLEALLGKPAIVVNNNAAAVYLALHELAAGFEVVVSRGELIEIGDGFRIPEIMRHSGAVLREVGTTNRTHIDDYREAINERTRLLLRVHPSNFRIEGFTARPAVEELAALGRAKGVPVYEDLGSGCALDLRPFGIDEPLAAASLRAGAALVSFSGDKLLGGPQAGILAGTPELVTRLRRNPMFRALRIDKSITQLLEGTLRDLLLERWDRIPALRMIRLEAGAIRLRAEALLSALPVLPVELIEGHSVIGGGSTPQQALPTWLIAIGGDRVTALERSLRRGDPPVVARIEDGKLLLDLRTVFPEEEPALVKALVSAAASATE